MSTLKADTVQSTGGGAVTLTKQQAPKLVVRYTTVSTTVTVGSPLNVASLTDNGTGDTSISNTSSFSDALYAILAAGTSNYNSSGNSVVGPFSTGSWTNSSSNQTSSVTRIGQRFASSSTATNTDVDITSVALIGDLA
jgi:hypothetical protein